MKPKFNVVAVALVLSAVSFSAAADPYNFVPAPEFPLPVGSKPVLFPSEQGAYAIIESLMQVAESYVVQSGCAVSVKKYITVRTDSNGNGTGVLKGADTLTVTSAFVAAAAGLGRSYSIGAGGTFNDLPVAEFSGAYSYNIGSQILSGSATWKIGTSVTPRLDRFSGLVIKDFWRPRELFTIPSGDYAGELVSSVIDWGYQVVSKKGYPAAKYWQASRTWRHDGISAETHFLKTRVAPQDNCTISVDFDTTTGASFQTANSEGFDQTGVISIRSASSIVGPFRTSPLLAPAE